MPDLDLDFLRAQTLSHPLLLFLLCLASFRVARGSVQNVAGTFAGKVPGPAAFAVAVVFAASAVYYVSIPAYLDHVEPAVASVSWAVMLGQQAYPGVDAAEAYGLPYGPMLYVANGLAMKLAGPGVMTSKLAGLVAALTSLIVTVMAVRRGPSSELWPRALGLTALLFLAFGATVFWTRAEPLLLLCSSLAALSLTLPFTASAFVAGIALGVGINLKVSAVIYLLPALAVLIRTHGLGHLLAVMAVGGVTAALPFVAYGNISALGYLYWVRTATAHGLRLASIPSAIEWAVLLIVPLIFANRTFVRMWLLVSILASLPLAAKYGTGAYHFLPFVPLIVFAATDRTESRDGQHGSVLAFIAAATVVAAIQLPQWISRADDLPAREITGELRGISSRHRGAIAMGYGGNYRLSFFRPLLVFDGHPYHLDGASLMDRHWSGSAFPRASIDLVRECRVGTWVIPVGGPPFVLPNAYPVGGDVIPLEFRRAFESRYRLVESGRWFDVWRCR